MIVINEILDILNCTFISRLNRFTVRIKIGDHEDNAHLTNTGRLHGVLVGGKEGLCMKINGSKLKYRLIALSDPLYSDSYMVIDTIIQNRSFEKIIENNLLPWFRDCIVLKRNPRVNDSLLDYLLECNGARVYVETKSAVLRGSMGEAMYPDCSSVRGRIHIMELMSFWKRGINAYIVFIAGMRGVRCFMPYKEGDQVIDELLCKAYNLGLPIHAFSIYMDARGRIYLDNPSLNLCSHWWCLSN